jgi:hypothetical protein
MGTVQVVFEEELDFVTSGEKGPTRADSAQLPIEHAQNTLPNMASSCHVTSGHFLSLPVAPPHSSSSNTT